jgi:hypothetical protein
LNKLLHPKNLPIAVTLAGLISFALRIWSMGSGTDAEGLYAPAPLPWALLWIITIAVPVLIIIMARPLNVPGKFADNFRPSIVSAIGSLAAALGLLVTALDLFKGNAYAIDTLTMLTGVIGILSGVLMIIVAYARLKGQKPNFLCHISVSLYLALRIFSQCKIWSNEPQIGIYLFPFLAQIFIMLAAYQLSAFDVELGKRPSSLLWSLSAVYLCLAALPSNQDVLFLGCMAIWLLTNLCSLTPIKKPRSNSKDKPDTAQAQLGSTDVSIDEIKTWLDED